MNDAIKKATMDTILEVASVMPFERHDLPETARFFELGIDSISMISLLLKLEDRLAVSLVQLGDEMVVPDTVKDLLGLVERLLELAGYANAE